MTSAWDGPIVDAHQHFWEPTVNNHPWLQQEARIPFRYGDYIALKRPYLPDDYKHDAAGQHIIQTVYVETEWDPTDPVGETRYASGLSERFGWPNAVVAQAWLNRPDVEEVLAEQARFPLVRSVRHKPEGPAHPRAVGSSRTLMSDPAWRNGFSLLGRYGLAFDLVEPGRGSRPGARLPGNRHHPESCRTAGAAGCGESGRVACGDRSAAQNCRRPTGQVAARI